MITAIPQLLARARAALDSVDFVVPHTDADGLASGAIALRHLGQTADDAILIGRGQTPFGQNAPLPTGSAAVLDWGVRPVFRPGLIADHHAPEVEPREDQVLLSSYGEHPEAPTAALMRRLVPEAPAWLAAVGSVGDLGDVAFRLPECADASKAVVRKLVPLINAPRRLPDGPVREALALLVEHDDPADILRDTRITLLQEAKRICRAEFDRVVRTPPTVRRRTALIRFRSDCQVHPLVAAAWARRLSPRIVIVANEGYLPGRVNFAVRGGTGDLRAFLHELMPTASEEYAHGHDRATGGSLTTAEFQRMLRALEVHG